MADYYPLIARAVGSLNPNTPEQRRALYDRARKTLVDQLRIQDPTLTQTDVKAESAALDAAISGSNEILSAPRRHRRRPLVPGRDPVRRRPIRRPRSLPRMVTCRRLRIRESDGPFSWARALSRF